MLEESCNVEEFCALLTRRSVSILKKKSLAALNESREMALAIFFPPSLPFCLYEQSETMISRIGKDKEAKSSGYSECTESCPSRETKPGAGVRIQVILNENIGEKVTELAKQKKG